MNTGDAVTVQGRPGIVCASLPGQLRVQILGAGHGPTWMDESWAQPGWPLIDQGA